MRALTWLAVAALMLAGAARWVAGDAQAVLAWPICTAAARTAGDWTFDPWITAPLLGSGLIYAVGLARLWWRAGIGRGVRPWQAASFAAGWFALSAALVSPLHHAGTQLFAAHMVEHELVMAVAAPLLVLARPGAAMLWAFPRRLRHVIGRGPRVDAVHGLWRSLTGAATATLLHGAAIWLWHVPALFDDAVLNVVLHRLQHVSFLATAILFWWAVIRRCDPGAACGHVFATMTHTGLLGALLALAPKVLYRAQTAGAPAWGMTPLEDQQLAGLVMWVPAGTIYAGAALALMAIWITRSDAPHRRAGHALRT